MRLLVIRLEHLVAEGDGLTSASSVTTWLNAISGVVDSLGLIAPIRTGTHRPGSHLYRPAASDRIFTVPSTRGYIRVALATPILVWQLVRARRSYSIVLCRLPEHGNALILPIVKLLRYNPVAWVVADRDELEATLRAVRSRSRKLAIGLALSRITGVIERRLLSSAPAIVNGTRLAKSLPAAKDKRRLVVLSSTLRTEDLPARAQRRCTVRRLLYVGRLSSEKGLRDLLYAFAMLPKTAPLSLTLAGTDSHGEESVLRTIAKDLSCDADIFFAGHVPYGERLFELYRNAELFVLPSRSEGTPRVLLEAMAFGLPIVATDVGGIPDIVTHGVNALLVPPANPTAIACAIETLIHDPTRVSEMSKDNWAKARDLTVETLAKQIAGFINHSYENSRIPSTTVSQT